MNLPMSDSMINKWFTEHPASVNETYFEHFGNAISFSWQLFRASIACLIHAFFPACCVKSGSKAISDLHNKMVKFRVKGSAPESSEQIVEESIEYMI